MFLFNVARDIKKITVKQIRKLQLLAIASILLYFIYIHEYNSKLKRLKERISMHKIYH